MSTPRKKPAAPLNVEATAALPEPEVKEEKTPEEEKGKEEEKKETSSEGEKPKEENYLIRQLRRMP